MKKNKEILKVELPNVINHPMHYNQGIECIEYVESHNMDFCQGNAIKYLTRYKHKNGLEDLKKARWYVDRLIKQMSENGGKNDKTNSNI